MATIEEKILTPIIDYYMNAPFELIEANYTIKERIATIRNMQIIIYSNDHNPPHFHVISRDNSVDAKFTLEDCTKISGDIDSKDEKRIKVFFADIKTQMVMKKVWEKKNSL